MSILALDLATRFGSTWGNGEGLPLVASWELPVSPGQLGAYLASFEYWLARRLTEWEPELVAFERPAPGPNNPPSTTRKLQGLTGVLQMVCHKRGIETDEFAPATVKKALTGNGRAKKPEMLAAARQFGVRPETHDAADSFGVWLHAVRIHRPEHADRWDPTSFQPRSAA